MSTEVAVTGSVTLHIAGLKFGEADAQRWLAERLLPQLKSLARQYLEGGNARAFDEEDVALEVLHALFAGSNRFRQFENRSDLEQLMVVLVRRKAIDAYRRTQRRRRHEVGESWLPFQGNSSANHQSETPSNEVVCEVMDAIRAAVSSIDCDEIQTGEILRLKLHGHSVAEIAKIIGRGERAIYRILDRVGRRLREM